MLWSTGAKSCDSGVFKVSKPLWRLVCNNRKKVGLLSVLFLFFSAANAVDSVADDIAEKKEATITSHGFFGTCHRHILGYCKNIGIHVPFLPKYTFYKNDRYISNGQIKTFNYKDVLLGLLPVALWNTSLGQYHDIKTFAEECQRLIVSGVEEINIHGISRGAASACNFVCIDKNTFEEKKKLRKIGEQGLYYREFEKIRSHVKTAVLESPFDNAKQVFANHNLVKLFSKIITSEGFYNITQKFSRYKSGGMQPIECAENMAKESKKIKSLIVCSLEDKLVTPDATIRLAIKMKEKNPKNTYVLILDRGKHGNLLNGPDGAKYCNVMHAFYKYAGVRHNKKFAEVGEKDFKECRKLNKRGLKKILKNIEKRKKFAMREKDRKTSVIEVKKAKL